MISNHGWALSITSGDVAGDSLAKNGIVGEVFAKNLLADAQLGVGDEVDIRVKEGIMISTPVVPVESSMAMIGYWMKCCPYLIPAYIDEFVNGIEALWDRFRQNCNYYRRQSDDCRK